MAVLRVNGCFIRQKYDISIKLKFYNTGSWCLASRTNVLQWKLLNVIAVNFIIRLMWSIFLRYPKPNWLFFNQPTKETVWLMLLVYLCPKAITLSGFHCIIQFSADHINSDHIKQALLHVKIAAVVNQKLKLLIIWTISLFVTLVQKTWIFFCIQQKIKGQ